MIEWFFGRTSQRIGAFLITLFVVLHPSDCRGQNGESTNRSFGVDVGARVGLTSTTLAGGDVDASSGSRQSPAAGIVLRARFPGPYAAQAEALYLDRGGGSDYGYYLEGSALLRREIPLFREASATPYAVIGPTYAMKTIATGSPDFQLHEVGAVAGLGLQRALGSADVSLDIRYRRGITDVFQRPGLGPGLPAASLHNQGVAVSAAILF
jgi:hypothetical protein